LQRDDVEQALEAVDRLGDPNYAVLLGVERSVRVVGNDDGRSCGREGRVLAFERWKRVDGRGGGGTWRRGVELGAERHTFSGGDLLESRTSLGVEGVLGHDEDDGHAVEGKTKVSSSAPKNKETTNSRFVDEGEGTVLELSCQNTFRVEIRELLRVDGRW